jgi:hypothetical protein
MAPRPTAPVRTDRHDQRRPERLGRSLSPKDAPP